MLMRPPNEEERQIATFVLLDNTISALDRLTATRIERGDAMPTEDLESVRELAYRSARRRKD